LIYLGRGIVVAGGAGPESPANGGGHRNWISGRGTDTELGTEKICLAWATDGPVGGCPDVEAVGHGSSCSRRIETEAGAPLASLGGGLLLLLLVVVVDLLGQHLRLKLLGLHRLCTD
jgi:hypothetical protein